MTQETLTWLVRFQINEELARQAGITTSTAQAQTGLAELHAAATSEPSRKALDEAGIAYRVGDKSGVGRLGPGGVVVWLPIPGADLPVLPGARLVRGSELGDVLLQVVFRARIAAERDDGTGPGVSPSVLDGVPFGQAALALAAQLQRRAARAGVPEELARLDADAGDEGSGIGRDLFRLVAKARELGLDPEMELRAAARRQRDLASAGERS